jgi:hypothetical protein
MKTRRGFVSNSSTTSFCIYGIAVDYRDEEANQDIEDKAHKAGFQCIYGPDYDEYIYLGRSWSSIKDDETGAEFKASVEEIAKEIFGKDKCYAYEEAWRDG